MPYLSPCLAPSCVLHTEQVLRDMWDGRLEGFSDYFLPSALTSETMSRLLGPVGST